MSRIFLEQREIGEDLRRLVEWLDEGRGGPLAECVPPLDVFETADTVEIVVDLPGIPADVIRIGWSRGVVVIAGQKAPAGCQAQGDAAFHLAERGFGRFTRVIQLSGALDAGRAQATLEHGELHIVFPRIAERRGVDIAVPVRVE
jgi:HSP20 family protein